MFGQEKNEENQLIKPLVETEVSDEDLAIHVDNVSKLYRLYPGQRARMIEWLTFGKRKYHYPFWALKNVSLRLPRGKALGIIGPNGSGKSTLLKMIAGTSSPTEGQVKVNGSVAALLELGAGFHGEFSGRQNIRMNAQIFGLTEEQIDARMDDIIEFAELDRFIDMPVKTYSSGMYARLGFAVASHLDPDVLIVDEALSVGDNYFQRKSLDRIIYFREQGKTILFVSHILPVVQRFCDEVIWLQDGVVKSQGPANKVIKEYDMWSLRRQEKELGQRISGRKLSSEKKQEYKVLDESWGSGEARIIKVEMLGEDGKPRWHFEKHERNVTIRMHYFAFDRIEEPIYGINFHRIDGIYIFGTANHHIEPAKLPPMEGYGYVDYKIDRLYLHKGSYFLSCGVYAEPDIPYWLNPLDWHNQKYEFSVLSDGEADGIVPFQGEWDLQDSSLDEEHVMIPTRIDFSDEKTPYILQKGWWQIEAEVDFSFAWTKEEANFLITHPVGSQVLEVKIKSNKPDIAEHHVSVSLVEGQQTIDKIVLENNDWKVVSFKLNKAEKSRIRHFKLVTDPCWSPKDFGTPDDDRNIGIGVSYIEAK